MSILILVLLTIVSAWGDSRGFIYAARAWTDGNPDWTDLGRAVTGYAIGIAAYLVALKYLRAVSDVGPSIQTAAWFLLTIVGVSIGSRDFFKWTTMDQALG